MRKKSKNTLLAAAGVVMLGSVAISVGTFHESAEAYEYTTRLFDGHGVTIKTEQSFGNGTGMLLSASNSGAYAAYKDELSGELTLCFELPEDDFGDTVSFAFTDKINGETFAVKLVTGAKGDSYFVSANGKNAGIYYSSAGEAGGYTASMNGDGYYTKIARSAKNTFLFNPNTMCLYINDKLIWNLLSSDNDGGTLGKTYGGFSVYAFDIGFEDVKDDSARLLIDSICGQSTNDKYLMIDDGSPAIYADVKLNAVKGEKYVIPEPKAYDVSDGALSSENVRASVSDTSGKVLLNAAWEKGLSFVPAKGGEKYKIVYEIADNSGNVGQVSFSVKSFSEAPAGNFGFSGKFVGGTVGVNGAVELPSATLTSDLLIENTVLVPEAVIYKCIGDVRTEIRRAAAGEISSVQFAESGIYEIVYEKEYYGAKFKEVAGKVMVREDQAGFSYVRFNENYSTGETVAIPDCKIVFGGKTADAKATVRYPDGSVYTAKEITPRQTGIYSVAYEAEIGGKTYSKIYTFSVTRGENEVFKKGVIESKIGAYPYDTKVKGLNVRLKAKTPAVYSEEIDFSAWNGNDTLIELLAISPEQNSVVYNKIKITLRDSEDYSNYFTILADGKTNTSSSQLTLKTNGYDYCAITGAGVAKYGIEVPHSFTSAEIAGRSASNNTISIRYDYEKGVLYARQADGSYAVFADFNNEEFTKVAGTFGGFTNGKAMLEVSFEYRDRATFGWWEQAYLYCGADVMILKMAGYDFTSGAIADITAPEIEVDAPKMLPNAVVGKPYAIFDSKAFDKIDGNIAPRVRVVYNFGTAQYVDVKIVDGKFLPTYTGVYSIVYTATDRAGNVAEVVKKITVLAHNPEDLRVFAADDGKNEYIQGETVALRKAEAQGGAGGTYEITATVFDENRQTIDVAENTFQALTPGVYTVEYRVKDYVGNSASFAYTVTVKEQALPQLQTEKLIIQPIFTAGQSYKLPKLKATDYAGDEPNDVAAEIYVRYPNGEFEKVADADAFVADENRVKHGDTLEFEYRFVGRKAASAYRAQAHVAKLDTKSGNIDFKNYFVYTGTTGELKESCVSFTTAGRGSALFGKNLLADGLNFSFNTVDDNLNALQIKLSDSVDPRISLLLSVKRTSNNYFTFSVNGGTASNIAAATANRLLDFSYNDNGKKAFVTTNISASSGNSVTADVKNMLSGGMFNGFTSGYVTAEIEFESKGSEETSVVLYSISGQSLGGVKDKTTGEISGTTRDYIGPKIHVNGEYMGTIREGEKFIVPSAIAGDVAGYVSQVTVSVSAAGGGYVTAEDGTILKNAPADKVYVISPKTAGRYGVRYDCYDSNNNAATFTTRPLYVNSRGSEGEIVCSYSGEMPRAGKIGENIALPSGIAESPVSVSVAVFDPYGMILVVSKNGAFVPKQQGKHIARYVFYDLSGRFAVEEFEIAVE